MQRVLEHPIDQRSYDYVVWGSICLVISLVGFWPSYVAPMAVGTYSSPSPAMPWHVLSAMLWLALLISQPWLILQKRVNLHRLFGVFGVVVAIGLVVTGFIVQVDVMGPYAAADDFANAVVIPYIRMTLLLGFAICIGLAIALRGRPDYHKRLILLGTFPLMQSAFDRMGSNVLGIPQMSGLLALAGHMGLMLTFLIWDRCRLGRFHTVTKWGTTSLILFYLVSLAFAGADWWRQIAEQLSRL